MDVSTLLAQQGGHATWRELRREVPARAVRRAVSSGLIERSARNIYVLAGIDDSIRMAASVRGVVSHRSAALLHGWEVWTPPKRPELTVPRRRNLAPARRPDAEIRWRDYEKEDFPITSALRTVVDCARDLPFVEALAVADSALRHEDVTQEDLRSAVHDLPRTGRAAASRVLQAASPHAANPFESALRAIAMDAVGEAFIPQVVIRVGDHTMRPDLVSEQWRIVIEADSFEFHTSRQQLRKDCHRYNELLLDGWLVLRFSWDHVFGSPEWVAETIARAVEQRSLMLQFAQPDSRAGGMPRISDR